MKRVLVLAMVVVMFGIAQFAFAADQGPAKKDAGKPGTVIAESVTLTATVDAVDAAKRVITFKFPDGTKRAFKVGKEVKNFDQIKAGDQLKTTYFESIAIFVRKATDKPGASEVESVGVAPKGEKPAIYAVDTSEVTAKVEAVDYTKRTVTLKGPEGKTGTFAVDKRVKKFKEVKTGDEVVVRVTDAIAIAVEKP